jgi:hypothetical protein
VGGGGQDDCAQYHECPSGCLDDYDCDYPNQVCLDGNCEVNTPIIIDTNGDGYELTSAASGVTFDMRGQGKPIRISWTSAGSDDAFLALDRNENGQIDNGTELFGSFTPQLHNGGKRNGFLALAVYDELQNGGNGDGFIDSQDAIYTKLLLWRDKNHNGISEPSELFTLDQVGITGIDLHYHPDKHTDEFGNRFRYRARVYDSRGANVGKWAYDVILVVAPMIDHRVSNEKVPLTLNFLMPNFEGSNMVPPQFMSGDYRRSPSR